MCLLNLFRITFTAQPRLRPSMKVMNFCFKVMTRSISPSILTTFFFRPFFGRLKARWANNLSALLRRGYFLAVKRALAGCFNRLTRRYGMTRSLKKSAMSLFLASN